MLFNDICKILTLLQTCLLFSCLWCDPRYWRYFHRTWKITVVLLISTTVGWKVLHHSLSLNNKVSYKIASFIHRNKVPKTTGINIQQVLRTWLMRGSIQKKIPIKKGILVMVPIRYISFCLFNFLDDNVMVK